jgi:predicted deacetylase
LPVHVSIHDVSPFASEEVEAALEVCHAAGVRPSLLVVPNFHGTSPLLDDAPFCQRLRSLQAGGHEIYLHGLRHQSAARYAGEARGVRRLRDAAGWLFAQRVVSGGEAEMRDVALGEGRARIEEGEGVLARAGLRVDGFVAPAWSMPAWLLPLLAERAYRYTEDHLRVYDPAAGQSRPSVVLNWASRSPARLLSTVAWCRAAKYARAFVPARIAIHPGDMRWRVLRREIERLLDWARGDFVSTGAELLRAGRPSPG